MDQIDIIRERIQELKKEIVDVQANANKRVVEIRDEIRLLREQEYREQHKPRLNKEKPVSIGGEVSVFIYGRPVEEFIDMYPDIDIFADTMVVNVMPRFRKFIERYANLEVITLPHLYKSDRGQPTWSAKVKVGNYEHFCHMYGDQWKLLSAITFQENITAVEKKIGLLIHANKQPIELPHQFPTDDD